MPLSILPPVESLTLVVPIAPQKGTTIKKLLAQAGAENLRRIHEAVSPALIETFVSGESAKTPFVRLVSVPRFASDNGNALRVVNVSLADGADIESSFAASQQVADLLNAPVRMKKDGDFLTAFGCDILLEPQQPVSSGIRRFFISRAYTKEHGSLFDGPCGAMYLNASVINRHNRVFVWGDPQTAPLPQLPATEPMGHFLSVDNAGFD